MDEAAYQSHVGGKRHKKQMVKHQKCANKTKEKHDSSKNDEKKKFTKWRGTGVSTPI